MAENSAGGNFLGENCHMGIAVRVSNAQNSPSMAALVEWIAKIKFKCNLSLNYCTRLCILQTVEK